MVEAGAVPAMNPQVFEVCPPPKACGFKPTEGAKDMLLSALPIVKTLANLVEAKEGGRQYRACTPKEGQY